MVLLWLGLTPKRKADEEKLGRGLQVLMGSDTSLAVKTRQSDGATMVGAESEAHLEHIIDRLVHEFDVEAGVTRLEIAYKEALTCGAYGEAKYAKQSGGRGQYGHVKIELQPGEPGSGFVFDNAIAGGAIPGNFVKPIAEGLREACEHGVLAGYPIEDVHVTLYDGSYHDVDSSPMAFKVAAAMAFQDAAKKAKPALLEPIMNVSVEVPPEYGSRVVDALSQRGARAQWFGGAMAGRGTRIVFTQLPLSQSFGYTTELRIRTDGHGKLTMTFSHYAPATLSEDDGDRDANVRSPLSPRTPPLILRASVPEPTDDAWDDDEVFRPYRS